jgi:predicted DNA repair protein MutK
LLLLVAGGLYLCYKQKEVVAKYAKFREDIEKQENNRKQRKRKLNLSKKGT